MITCCVFLKLAPGGDRRPRRPLPRILPGGWAALEKIAEFLSHLRARRKKDCFFRSAPLQRRVSVLPRLRP